jgi:hypothetical protein
LLKESVLAVKAQTYPLQRIIIIDNHSTDGTADYLQELSEDPLFKIITMDKNLGGAGGFSEGIKQAAYEIADWIWVMDDDTIPQSDSLEKLLDVVRSKDAIGFLASRVLWTDGTEHIMNMPHFASTLDENQPIREIISSSFVSMLINSDVINKLGLPYRQFFIWGDDSEYSERITRNGFRGLYVSESVVLHKTAANYGPELSTAPINTAWKFYYQTRNQLFLRRRKSFPLLFIIKELNHLRLALHNINKRKPDERSTLRKNVIRGFRDGLFFNPQIEYLEEKDS